MAKNNNLEQDSMANVEEALTASERFIEKNQKSIIYTVLAIVLVVLAVLAFRNFYIEPQNAAADNEIYTAQAYFQVDSFRVALEGDNNACIGFEAIADQYGITKAGKLANYYAGICHYKMGNYEEAIAALKKYNGKDKHLALAAQQLLGDAYAATENFNQAAKCFEKVAKANNTTISPMSLKKLGVVYEAMGDNVKAIEAYKNILNNYPQSLEASEIEKDIARLEQVK